MINFQKIKERYLTSIQKMPKEFKGLGYKLVVLAGLLFAMVGYQNCSSYEAANLKSNIDESYDYRDFCVAEEHMLPEDMARKDNVRSKDLDRPKLNSNSVGHLNNEEVVDIVLTQKPIGMTGWKAGSYDGFETHGNVEPENLSISNFTARKGFNSFKFKVPDEQSPNIMWKNDYTHRVEVSGPLLRENSKRWYKLSLFFPEDMYSLRSGYVYQLILAQIWQKTLPCGGHTNPPFTLKLSVTPEGNTVMMASVKGSNLDHYRYATNEYKDHSSYYENDWVLLNDLPKGQWMDLYFYLEMSHHGEGKIKVLYGLPQQSSDLTTLVDEEGLRIGHNCDCGAFYKFGAYIGKWNVKAETSYYYEFYIDDVAWATNLEDLQ